jgi:hypothetical protein
MSRRADEMRALGEEFSHDPEVLHGKADDLLLEILESAGWGDVVREYRKLQEVPSWWATA